MTIELNQPAASGLREAIDALREWQHEGAAMQLHPGDLGWFWRFGDEETAAAVRVWRRDGRMLAVGLLDGRDLLRLTIAPDARRDEELAAQLAADLGDPARGVLVEASAALEAPADVLLQEVLAERGWATDDPWTPLRRDLANPVEHPGVRVEEVRPETVSVRTAVQRAAFDSSSFTDERWRAMAGGPAYSDARCLIAFTDDGDAAAAITVWGAGAGRPGLIEPMGVDPRHRGHGFGRAITVAAAAALRDLGSSSAIVCTPSSNVAGVATYVSAGFERMPEVRDRIRPA